MPYFVFSKTEFLKVDHPTFCYFQLFRISTYYQNNHIKLCNTCVNVKECAQHFGSFDPQHILDFPSKFFELKARHYLLLAS